MAATPQMRSLESVVEGATGRWRAVLGSVRDLDAPVPDLEWSIGELAAHLVSLTRSFQAYARHQVGPEASYADLARFNRDRMSGVEMAGPSHLAADLRAEVAEFLRLAAELGPEAPFPWFDGHVVDVRTALAVLGAELLVHGRDLARAVNVSWPIPSVEARLVVTGMMKAAPAAVDPAATAGVDAHARIRLWGGEAFGIRIADGEAAMTDATGPVDVTLWIDPASFLLVTFGRIHPLRPALTGRALVWGRRPTLALRLPSMFIT